MAWPAASRLWAIPIAGSLLTHPSTTTVATRGHGLKGGDSPIGMPHLRAARLDQVARVGRQDPFDGILERMERRPFPALDAFDVFDRRTRSPAAVKIPRPHGFFPVQ